MAGRLLHGLDGWRKLGVAAASAIALLSSAFAGILIVSAMNPDEIEVRVFLDSAADGLADGTVGDGLNPALAGVVVRLWADDGPSTNVADAGDTFVGSYVTDAAGTALVSGLSTTQTYWVTVDSASVQPPTGSSGVGIIWLAEQTYGPAGSLDATESFTATDGLLFGGRDPLQGDDPVDHQQADHIALLSPGGSVAEFGFSFDVVTNVEGGVVQGSLEQFLVNANNVAGPNRMKFAPAVAPNRTVGAASYWEIDLGGSVPTISDADTVIDGTAFGPGGSVVDPNPGLVSVNAGAAMGTRGAVLPGVERPELMVRNGGFLLQEVSGVRPDRVEVRDLLIDSNDTSRPAVRVTGTAANPISDVLVSGIVVGTQNPTTTAAASIPPNSAVVANYAPSLRIEGNYLAHLGRETVTVRDSPAMELRWNEMTDIGTDGFNIISDPGTVVEANLISAVVDYCIDAFDPDLVIRDNTFTDCGDGAGQSGGVRIGDGTALVEYNLFDSNNGPGIVVAGENTNLSRAAGRAVISRNSFTGNDSIAIDNHVASTDNLLGGDGISVNDGTTTATAGNALLDYPVITSVLPGAAPGTADVTGTACANCVVELYAAIGGADDVETGSGDTHGEGVAYLVSVTADGSGNFSVNIPNGGLTAVSATATDTGLGATSEFGANVGVQVFGGRVLLDPDGNADLADAQPAAGVTVRVYQDLASAAPGQELPDPADPLVATLTTGADGSWAFTNATGSAYWVTIDSRTVAPPAVNAGFSTLDTWADQTWGPAGSLGSDGSGGTATTVANGPVVGGRTGAGTDVASALATAEHVFRVDPAVLASDLDTAFSFNLVTNTAGGDGTDLAPGEPRTQQGTLRQFLQNANAISGPNPMRFVPAVPVSASGGGNSWWRLIVTVQLPSLTDASTVVDGTAWDFADPTAPRDLSPGELIPAITVGAQARALAPINTPDLQLWGDRSLDPAMDGFVLRGAGSEIHAVGLLGFDVGADLGAGPGDLTTGFRIEDAVFGIDLVSGGDPGAANRLDRGVVVNGGVGAIVTRSGLGFTKRVAVEIGGGASSYLVDENRLVSPAIETIDNDGITLLGAGDGAITANHIQNTPAFGIDVYRTEAIVNVSENTVDGFGSGGLEEGAIRVFGTGSTVDANLLQNGTGSPVVVAGGFAGDGIVGRPGRQALIENNRFGPLAAFSGGTPAAAIDLGGPPGAGPELGDGPTPNDGADGCGYTPGYGNDGIDFPVIAVESLGTDWRIIGTGCPGSVVQVYAADAVGGQPTFPAVQVALDGAGAIDTVVPAGGPLASVQFATASQINARNTSEFGPAVEITGGLPPVITNPGTQNATEFAPFSLTLVGSDPDSAPIVWTLDSGPPGMTLDPSSGELSWTPDESHGGTTVAVTVGLTGGATTVTATFDIVVAEDDQAPLVDPIGPGSATTGVLLVQPASGNDPDTPAEPLTWSLAGVGAQPVPAGMTIDPGTGVILYNPPTAGSFSVEVVATQPNALSGSTVWAVAVSDPVGPPPVVTPPADQTVDEGQTATLDFDATNATSFLLVAGPTGATIDPLTGVVTWPTSESDGGSTATFTVEAGGPGGSATGFAQVTVRERNDPPLVTPVTDRTVRLGDRVVVPILAADPDAPAQSLSYVVLAGPAGLVVEPTGRVIWPEADPLGAVPVTVRVSDTGSPSMSADVTFTITVVLPPPTTTTPTTLPPTTTTTALPPTTTTTGPASTTTTEGSSTSTTEPDTAPTTVPPPDPPTPSLPVDEDLVNILVPDLEPPGGGGAGEGPTLSLASGIPGLLRAPSAFQIPSTTIGLAGAWIFVLGVPLVLWERKRAVSAVAGLDADDTLPVFATRNSTFPVAHLRPDAAMLWSRYRFMGLGEGQRVKIESPIGPVWVERAHLRPLHEPLSRREANR